MRHIDNSPVHVANKAILLQICNVPKFTVTLDKVPLLGDDFDLIKKENWWKTQYHPEKISEKKSIWCKLQVCPMYKNKANVKSKQDSFFKEIHTYVGLCFDFFFLFF